MMYKFIFAIAITLTSYSLHAASQSEVVNKDDIHMFPQAPEGYVRYVIELPKTDNDHDHKVELLIGKNMMVDCNRHSLAGRVESVTLRGWGYRYLKVTDIRNGPSTMMACSEPEKEGFISLPGEFSRYNSLLPIVVYVPSGFDVRYRIWSASEEVKPSVQR